jgi:hypothetical protein
MTLIMSCFCCRRFGALQQETHLSPFQGATSTGLSSPFREMRYLNENVWLSIASKVDRSEDN